MVAALGVNAFAIELTNRETAQKYEAKVAKNEGIKDEITKYADVLVEIEKLYVDYEKAYGEMKNDPDATKQDFAALDKEYQTKLTAIKNSDKDFATQLSANAKDNAEWEFTSKVSGEKFKMPAGDPFVLNTNHDTDLYAYWDVAIAGINNSAPVKALDSAIADDTAEAKYYNKLADKEDAAAAEAAAKAAADAKIKEAAEKLEKAALKAAQAAVKDPKNSAEWMAYWAAYEKVYADKNLADAKDSANAAKKTVQTAQKAAVAQAQLAVENAQVVAYNNMATEINKAVTEYISGVNDALVEFYAGLYE